jgi:hypothetical protein
MSEALPSSEKAKVLDCVKKEEVCEVAKIDGAVIVLKGAISIRFSHGTLLPWFCSIVVSHLAK